jgi:hypothetical protein
MKLQEEPEVTRNLVESCRRTASESWTKTSEHLEEQIRQHPRYYILAAILFGYVLQVVPFWTCFRLFARLFLLLARPVLLLIFGLKAVEYLARRKATESTS